VPVLARGEGLTLQTAWCCTPARRCLAPILETRKSPASADHLDGRDEASAYSPLALAADRPFGSVYLIVNMANYTWGHRGQRLPGAP